MSPSAAPSSSALARALATRPAAPLGALLLQLGIGAIFAFFFTNADLLFGRRAMLPLAPTLLFPALIVPLVAVGFVFDARAKWQRLIAIFRNQGMVLGAFALGSAISLLWSISPSANWAGGGRYIFLESYQLLCFGLALALATNDLARRGFRPFVAGAFALLVLTIVADLIEPGSFAKHHSRAAGLGGDPNVSSTLLVVACVLLIDPVRPAKRDLALLGCTGMALFATLSRTGFVLFGLVLAALGAQLVFTAASARMRRRFVGVLTITTLGLVGAALTVQSLADREIGMFSAPATQRRVQMMTGGNTGPGFFDATEDQRVGLLFTHLKLATERPWFGHGTAFSTAQPRSAHNRYVRQWTDYGIVGVLSYGLLLGLGFMTARRNGDRGLMLLWAVIAAASFVDNLILDNRGLLLALGLRSGITAVTGRST